ncbi:MAG: Type 1 glutamine amidotransferase-like domain-containing protein [Gemmatimonadetes bacterium]|nr:Type 1 glutamine amidotransferase-like domain-containing protein [Gemmatimonadota bacterium]
MTRSRRSRRGRKRGSANRVVLLGPLTDAGALSNALRDLEDEAPASSAPRIAAITAGWREREGDPSILGPALAPRVEDLALYRRAERVVQADPELGDAHKELQTRLKLLRRAYNLRLSGEVQALVRLEAIDGDERVLDGERDAALEAIRTLDAHHLDRVADLRSEFVRAFDPGSRSAVRREREALGALLEDRTAVLIAGGHIATLLNRLRLFGLDEPLEKRTVVAWSAGAMALAETVVLFHDRPPWGAGNAEVFDAGLGLLDDVIPLPHATDRLRLDDRRRAARLARRLAPLAPVLLDPGVRVDRRDGSWSGRAGARRIDRAGRTTPFRVAAA